MNNTQHVADYFPLSVAEDQAFCNRTEEIDLLRTYIGQLRPVLLTSPRRYGKTSLALRVIKKMAMPYAHFDFFSVVDESDIERVILQGIGMLISSMESAPKKALGLANEIFSNSNIQVSLSNIGISVDIKRKKEKSAYNVLDILEKLEKLAIKTDRKVILFFDEFQCLGNVTADHAMEAVFRQIAQLTKAMSFIFSGSNRHLLNQMFEDRNRPFYKLCEKISLDRISEEAYTKHLQKIAKKYWDKEIPERSLDAIFLNTELHPYYVNLLCSRVMNFPTPPPNETVNTIWEKYIIEERSSVASEVELLSKNQRKLLTSLARLNGSDAPMGHDFIKYSNMSKTTISQSLLFLEKKDYVFQDKQGTYKVLDPLIASVLST